MVKSYPEQLKQGWPYFILLGFTLWFVINFSLRFNVSDSLNEFIFLITRDKSPQIGSYIEFMPPLSTKTSRKVSFVKIIKGVPGDKVSIEGRDFYINNEFIGTALKFTKSGIPLNLGFSGIIPPGHYFVWTPNKDSYDSRYADLGLISNNLIRGIAYPISIAFLTKKLLNKVV